MKLDDPGLENDIVRLEVLKEEDRVLIESSGVDPDMWSWMPVIATGTSLHTYFDEVQRARREGTMVPFKVFRQSDGVFAGMVAFVDVSRTHRRLRVGFLWHPEEMRGTAVGPATQLALLERALGSRIRRIEYCYVEDNDRAIRAAQKLGCQRDGILRNYVRAANGAWANVVVLSLVDSEIRASADVLKDRVAKMQLA
jgi:RimJ/RimL family protein N-acetyltransferase